jgi:hypothetical protein
MKAGDALTVNSDVISNSGKIIFSPGDKVTVSEVLKAGGYYGKVSGYWINERIIGVKLKWHYGIWSTSIFSKPG